MINLNSQVGLGSATEKSTTNNYCESCAWARNSILYTHSTVYSELGMSLNASAAACESGRLA